MKNSPALIFSFADTAPQFSGPPLHADASAAILGRSVLGARAWLGARSVIRGDGNFIQAGDDLHLGPRSTLHIVQDRFPCIVGDRVFIGENSCVHACTLGNDIIVGNDVVILDGAIVEDDVVFEDGATVFPGKHIAGGKIYAGSPAAPLRDLENGEVAKRRMALANARPETGGAGAQSAIASDSKIDASVFIASTASARGRLDAAEASSVWFGNDFDAAGGVIRLGPGTNTQDNTVIRCSTQGSVIIGAITTIGHNVVINDCVIGDRCLIGIGSVIAPGTQAKDDVLLAAGAHTEPGQILESGFLYSGRPARQRAALDQAKYDLIARIPKQYSKYAAQFKAIEDERKSRS